MWMFFLKKNHGQGIKMGGMGLSHVFYSFPLFLYLCILANFCILICIALFLLTRDLVDRKVRSGQQRSNPFPDKELIAKAMVRIRVFGVQHSVEPGSPHAAFASLVGCSTPEPSWLHAKGTFRPGSHETRESTIPAEPGDISPVNDSINTYLMHNKLF